MILLELSYTLTLIYGIAVLVIIVGLIWTGIDLAIQSTKLRKKQETVYEDSKAEYTEISRKLMQDLLFPVNAENTILQSKNLLLEQEKKILKIENDHLKEKVRELSKK